MAAAIMGEAAIAVRSEEKHLVLEGVGAERPAVAENDWLSACRLCGHGMGHHGWRRLWRGDFPAGAFGHDGCCITAADLVPVGPSIGTTITATDPLLGSRASSHSRASWRTGRTSGPALTSRNSAGIGS